MKALSVVGAQLVLLTGLALAQSTTNVLVTVQGTQGPWEFVNGGLNTAYPFGIGGNTAPTVVNTNNGLRFSTGDSLTVGYVSGLINIGPESGWPYTDANGDRSAIMDTNYYGGWAPASFMNPATFPIYAGELLGTFANSNGQIVGTPFAIGDLGTFTIPAGATQLQLGVNDVEYGDNVGTWTIQVTGPAVTPPSTCPNLLGTWSGQMNVANIWGGYSTTPLLVRVTGQSTNGCLISGFLTQGNVSNGFPNVTFGWNPWYRMPFTGAIPDGSTVLLNVGGVGAGRASATLDIDETPPVLTKFVYQPDNGDTLTGDLTMQPSSP